MHKNLGAAGLVLLSVGHQAVENCRFMTPLIGLVGWPPLPTDWPSSSVAVSRKTRLQVVRTKNRQCPVSTSASKSSIRRFVITERAPTRAFSWLKVTTTAFTFKTLLRHYAKRALTPRSLNVKLGPRRKGQGMGSLIRILSYSRPSLMIIASHTQFHIERPWGQHPFSVLIVS